jgi:hypothetical protein
MSESLVPIIPTSLNICQAAGVLIGDTPITSFSDGSAAATVFSHLYSFIIERELTQMAWSFGSNYAALGQPVAAEPVTRYGFAYELPDDPKALIVFGVQDANGLPIPFEIRDGKVLCDIDGDGDGSILYGFRAGEESFAPYFTLALIQELGGYLASGVTHNAGLAKLWLDKAENEGWPHARLKDSQARTTQSASRARSRFISQRRGP